MAYIGKTPTVGNFQVCDAISVVNGQAAYTMQVGGVNVSPESANHMLVSLNGILQAPTSSFTVSGSTITFASALETGDVIDFIQILGNVLDLGVPSDSTVSLDKLTATGTKDATTFLRGDNTFAEPAAGGITMVDQWRSTAAFTGNADPIASNLEREDTAPALSYFGSGMTESSGIFTFPSTGIYMVQFFAGFKYNGDSTYCSIYLKGTTDGSTLISLAEANTFITRNSSSTTYSTAFLSSIVDIQNTSNNKVGFVIDLEDTSVEVLGNTSRTSTGFRFIRLGDT